MLNVPLHINPKVTELQAIIARLDMRGNGKAKAVHEVREKKLAGQHNINDKESRIAMVMAEQDIPATDDLDAQLTTLLLQWEAIEEAKESYKPKLAAAKYEAATAILTGLKPAHDKIMKRLLAALVEASAANAELFDLRSQLRDKSIGFRCGVCELDSTDVLGVLHKLSDLAEFMRSAVAGGYLSTLPKEFK
jgi:hypothetical protein